MKGQLVAKLLLKRRGKGLILAFNIGPFKSMSKETIEKIFKKLPEVERKRPALIIDGKVLTWEELWIEVRNDGPLTKKILKKMEEFMKKWKK